ncbi:MAG TPA: CcmD family protein [Candidatus Polarisedimenticolia bacterium]|nr:CcmD family protein [Candidatus Polarisedimenticolia bacterium]
MNDWHLSSLASIVVLLAQEPVTGFTAENVAARPEIVERGLRFLNYAYTAVWVILSVYVLTLSIRLRRLSLQVRRLKERAGL